MAKLTKAELDKILEKSRDVLLHSLNEDIKRYDLEMENWNLRVGSEISISISSKVNSIIKINEVLEPLA
tara:strand:+ start:1413 stop:1619 length:207 start_codon:yes stop_codon:yes gene_type:complete